MEIQNLKLPLGTCFFIKLSVLLYLTVGGRINEHLSKLK